MFIEGFDRCGERFGSVKNYKLVRRRGSFNWYVNKICIKVDRFEIIRRKRRRFGDLRV